MPRLSAGRRRIHTAALKLFAEKGSTEVSISELAQAAGMARGTIYNNVPEPEKLFEAVAADLASEMNDRIVASYAGIEDPAARLAIGIRLYVRRAHEEPHWGRFLVHFGFSNRSLQDIWTGPPMKDLLLGMQQSRYTFRPEQVPSAIGVIAGSTMSAILLVLDGLRTWRDAGTDTTAMVLVALGLSTDDAQALSSSALPALAELPD